MALQPDKGRSFSFSVLPHSAEFHFCQNLRTSIGPFFLFFFFFFFFSPSWDWHV